MSKTGYSPLLCEELAALAADPELEVHIRPDRYEPDRLLDVAIEGLLPAIRGRAELEIEKFLGGGFAGQVYRCRLHRLDLPPGSAIPGLLQGGQYAVKIYVPPSGFSRRFRDFIYWLGFQGAFSAQVSASACRSGLLWQKLLRRGGRIRFGREDAVKDAYASFWEPGLGAYGEITEWVEGRQWLLESDSAPQRRRDWRNVHLAETHSAEYVAKRRFMAGMVELMHEMGAPELARQYEWWTMKSQPNAIKRTGGNTAGPGAGLCAIDFRPGLALLPFLPMSPGDIKLILGGLSRRGALVQFDRCDTARLRRYVDQHAADFSDLGSVVEELAVQDAMYRRSQPDLAGQGLRLLADPALRRDVRSGLAEGYVAAGWCDAGFAELLRESRPRFAAYYLLGAVPILGRLGRRLWGHAAYRRHIQRALSSGRYLGRALRARVAHRLIAWHRSGRTGEAHTRVLARHPSLFFIERFTLGLLPFAGLHRLLTEPLFIFSRIREWWRFLLSFMTQEEFRQKWFLEIIEDGERSGMLTPEDKQVILAETRDAFVVKYLKCVGVHFCTLPVTQIVSVALGTILALWMLAHGRTRAEALGAFGGVLLAFQLIPISPGSLCRGLFVVYLMIRERNLKDYLIAAPISFVKYIGYLAFPLQMTATYPELARFMASRWASSAVHVVPVFGEKGALLEHWVFDLFFNVPQAIGRWCRPRIRGLLTSWLILGAALCAFVIHHWDLPLHEAAAVNWILGTICVFVLPRVLFYPLLARRR